MPFLLKALRNVKAGRCMKESISIIMNICKGYNFDMTHYSKNNIDDIDEEEPEDQDSLEDVKDLAWNLQHQLNIVDFIIDNCAKYNEAVK